MEAGGDCGRLQRTVIKASLVQAGKDQARLLILSRRLSAFVPREMVGPKTAGIVAAVKDVQLAFQLKAQEKRGGEPVN